MSTVASVNSTLETLTVCVNSLGVAIVPLWGVDEKGYCRCPKGTACDKSPGKHPNWKLAPNGFKNATRDLSVIREWVKRAPNGNWGITTGEPLHGGGFLGVLDEDPRNGSVESLVEIAAKGCEIPETPTQATGGGGRHRLLRFDSAPESRLIAPGLDFQGVGKYIVIAPSKHVSGGIYTWELGLGPGDLEIAPAPKWLADGTADAAPRPAPDGGTARETVLGELFALSGRAGAVMTDGTMFVNCPQSHLHSDARGRGEDSSTVILPPAGGSLFGGFKCSHGHCSTLKWEDVVKMLPQEHYDAANRKYPRLGVAVPEAASEPANTQTPSPDEDAPQTEIPGVVTAKELDAVRRRLSYKSVGKQYKIKCDPVNVATILTYDPRWSGVLKWDAFGQVLRLMRPAPWHADDVGAEASDAWTDEDTVRLDLWLRRNWDLELAGPRIREVVYVVGRRDAVNPLTDYLDSLQWDGVARVDKWLHTYGGATDNSYSQLVGRKWLLSAVARGYEPGCKVDTCAVFEGPQGRGKSSMLRALVPNPSWFSDTPIDIGSKDAYVAIRGKWIIELAELASLKKADLDRAKAFFTSPIDSYRPPYGREQICVSRTNVFAGTVNLGEYLNDATGARRFWPVLLGVIDLQALIDDRDQIWAEAVHVYKSWVSRGRPQSECLWWPSLEETPMFEGEQETRQVAGTGNPWTEAIAIWLQTGVAKQLVEKHGFLLLRDVALGALQLNDRDLDAGKLTTIGIVLKRELKWEKKRVKIAGARTWGYSPPAVA